MTRGHVFVVHADLTRLACDDIVVPTDRWLATSSHWHRVVPASLRVADLGVDEATWRGRRWAAVEDGVWLVDTGGDSTRGIEWYVDGVRRVLAAVAEARAGTTPARDRARHLVALPLVGVGAGGARARRGEVIAAVLDALEEHADAGFDVALVLSTARDHGAVQHVRREQLRERPRHDLRPEEVATAQRLAQHAQDGELALFLGAGVSMSAGLPSWGGLLDRLAEHCALTTAESAALRTLPPQDAASLLELSVEGSLVDALRAVLSTGRYGLSHALLAALPVREAVTTNYDGLLEDAWRAIGREPAVLPFDPPQARQPWVLKLHGDLAQGGVVLTRDQYLAFEGNRGALAGVVQGLLMTRHMLFAGFGMADDNFLKLAHGVRQVREDDHLIGTALSLLDDPVRRRLWQGRLTYQSFGPGDGSFREAARRLEIFLDLVAHEATDDAAFLLDARYRGMLTADEAQVATVLADLDERLPVGGAVAQRVRRLLREMGGGDEVRRTWGQGRSQRHAEATNDS